MVALASLDRVKAALRVDSADDDAVLGLYIEAASAAVINYLKDRAKDYLGDGSDAEIAPELQVATIMLVGHFYKEPDGDAEKAFARGYLPAPVTALLCPLRDPALK